MHSEDSDQTGCDDQADLSLRWAHCHFVGFVMRWLIYYNDPKYLDGQVWTDSVEPDQTAPEGSRSLIRVYTVIFQILGLLKHFFGFPIFSSPEPKAHKVSL